MPGAFISNIIKSFCRNQVQMSVSKNRWGLSFFEKSPWEWGYTCLLYPYFQTWGKYSTLKQIHSLVYTHNTLYAWTAAIDWPNWLNCLLLMLFSSLPEWAKKVSREFQRNEECRSQSMTMCKEQLERYSRLILSCNITSILTEVTIWTS